MTIRARGEGRWMVDVQIEHTNGTAERARKVFRGTKRDALAYERELRRALLEGTRGKETESEAAVMPTLTDFADMYMSTYATNNNRPRTVREKTRMLRATVLPFFGAMRLDQIGALEIEKYKAGRVKDGRAPKTINEEVSLLGAILWWANEIGRLDKVPRIRKLRLPPPTHDFLDDEDSARLIEGARTIGDPWGPMIFTALRTGLRLGELRGLRWEDVDLRRARILVRVSADNEGELHPPKNGKTREVDLGEEVRDVLRSHKHLRGPHVFCLDDGGILPQRTCQHGLERACKQAGLRLIGWHVLRHTFASVLVMRGATLRAVQDLLGHGSLTMTMRYSHLSPGARRDAVRLLESSGQRQHGGNAGGLN